MILPRRSRVRTILVSLLFGGLVGATIVAQVVLHRVRLEVRSEIALYGDALPDAMLRLERAMGYAGFIHNFKNMVLRPDEPVYAARARADYAVAAQALDELDQLSTEAGLALNLEPVRLTLAEYRAKIDEIADLPPGSSSPAALDELVRVDDSAADAALRASVGLFQRTFRDRLHGQVTTISTMLRLIEVLTVSLLAAVTLFGALRFRAQRARLSEIEALNTRLASTNVALQLANGSLSDFAYVASHDLKVPMRGLANHARFLSEDQGDRLDAEGQRRLLRMQGLCTHLEGLVDALLRYAQIGRGQEQLPVDPTLVVTHIRDTLAPQLETLNGRIEIETTLPQLLGNPAEIGMLFHALIVNALTYNTAPERVVRIGMTDVAHNGPVEFEQVFYVRDNGIGIDPEFHTDVFRMFKRLHQPGLYVSGPGAGLSNARKVVESCEGEIWLTSTLGAGMTFYFTLPRALRDAQALSLATTSGARHAA